MYRALIVSMFVVVLIRDFHARLAVAALESLQNSPKGSSNSFHFTLTDTAPRDEPVVHPDRRITFRLRAPEAAKVALSLEGEKPMVKDTGGVWTITVGPLEAGIWSGLLHRIEESG